jgi:hypothetical protein
MLSFATEFPVNDDRDATAFIHSIERWILGSPHTRFTSEDLASMPDQAEWELRKGNEHVHVIKAQGMGVDAVAARYTRSDSGLEWETTIVFSCTPADAWVGLRVACESQHPAVRLPPAKKPVVVRTLLEELGGATDGNLVVADTSHRLTNTNIPLAASLITGQAQCRLPVVYVSAGFHGEYLLDVDRLASDLAGLAHVVVEPNRQFSLRLKIDVSSMNVYGGTIGIYWPDGGGRRSFFIGQGNETSSEIAKAIGEEIRTALVNRRPLHRVTWAAVQASRSRSVIEALRASGSQEVERYAKAFDGELDAKEQRIADAEREVRRLRRELDIYEAKHLATSGIALGTGDEQDFYPNEIINIVRDALRDAPDRVPADSRRRHVLAAVLNANPELHETADRREALKELLRDFRNLDQGKRKALEDMGFQISEEGKHIKITFQGDDRYVFTLPKSGSDHRGGLNAASDIARLLF